MPDDPVFLDATAQAELVRRGDATPTELVEAAIARIERLNPEINAVIHPLFAKARAAAAGPLPDGPFRGVPFLVKDLLCMTAGDPFHMGARPLRDAGFVAPHDSYLARKLRAAGLVIVGRTNTPELGVLPTTEPAAYGPTRNPWDPARSTGGSSGGAAAAVAAGLVPAAHGGDGGGSIRIPASACGLVGLKPSRARTSLGPDLGEALAGLVVEGVLTRTVRDSAALLDAIAGAMRGDPYTAPPPSRPFRVLAAAAPPRLRVGLLARAPARAFPLDPECVAAAEHGARLLADLGHAVETAHPAALDEAEAPQHVTTMFATHTARLVDLVALLAGRPVGPVDFDGLTWALVEMGRAVAAPRYIEALEAIHAYARRVAGWWAEGFDLLVTPTLPTPPPPLGAFDPTADPLAAGMRASQMASFTAPFNMTGQPAISLPLHWNAAGLPIGVQLVAAAGREDLLLQVAAQLEAAAPWTGRRPRVHA